MDVVSIGEAMLALNPGEIGRLRAVETFHRFPGGAETNTLIGLCRLGFKTRWISLLGEDEFGHFIINRVGGEGVDVSTVKLVPGSQTGVFFIERSILEDCKSVYYRQNSAMRGLKPEDIEEYMINDAKILYLTGITPVLNENCRNAVLKAVHIAKENGKMVVLDPNVRLRLLGIEGSREVLIPLIKMCHIIMPNDTELGLLFPDRTIDDIAAELLDNGVEILVVKKGKHGAAAFTRSGSFKVDAFHLENIASTMGAGDAFNAGFISGLLEQVSIEECLRRGAAMGAFATMCYDSYQSLPSRFELDNFLEGRQVGFVR